MQDELELATLVVFKVDKYHLALPINTVLRVVEYSLQPGENLSTMGLTQIGLHTIKILDLHQSLSGDRPAQPAESARFLVVTHDAHGQPYGIPAYTPPDLIEMPLRLMQALPRQTHPNTILKIASHAAVISQDDATTTVFLLDLNRANDLLRVEYESKIYWT